MGLMARIITFFKKRPLMMNVMGYGGMYVGAEFSQQTLAKKVWKDDKDLAYDWKAVGRYAVMGFMFYPVVYHHWYRYLDNRFVGTSLAVITKKSLIDQFVMEPPLLASFYIGMSVLEGQEDIFEECKKKYIPTFATGCVYWLPAMALNFWLIPPSMRVLFMGVCMFMWCNFLCWYKRQ